MGRSYETISPEEFRAAAGVDEWRVRGVEAFAVYRTGSFATGLALVNEIGRLAEEADHHPDLNLRYGVLAIRLSTHDAGALTTTDLDLARAISTVARDADVSSDPDAAEGWDGS